MAKFDKILIIRHDRLGDVILTLPVAELLREKFPQSQIDFLVNENVHDIVELNPNINNVLTIENDTFKDFKNIFNKNKYDLAVFVKPSFYGALAALIYGVKHRIGTGYRAYSFLFNLRHFQHRKHSIKHELEYNLDLLKEIKITPVRKYYPIINVSDNSTSSMLDKHKDLTDDYFNKRFIIIHPFSRDSALKWSVDNFIKLIEKLNSDKDFNFKIIITGTEKEAYENKDKLNSINYNKVKIISDLNLKELVSLITNASLFISNSTGPIHIAAALNVNVIGIYSPIKTESFIRWGPYTDKRTIFTPETYDLKIREKQPLMEQITVEKVYKSVLINLNLV